MGFDIEAAAEITKAEDEGVVVAIIDPRSGEEAAKVTIVGTYSATYRREWDALTNRLIRQRKIGKASTEEKEREEIQLVAACILDWEGIRLGGRDLAFSKPNAITLLTKAPFILEQLSAAMRDHERFFSNGSGTSSPTPATSGD